MFLVACERNMPQDVQKESTQTNEVIEPGKVLIVTGEYLPYTSSDTNNPGFLDATVIEVLNRSGIDYEVRYFPWERCREMLRNGEAWASYPYGFSEDNMNDFNFSVPIFRSQHLYYYRENQDIFNDSSKIFEDLQDFKDNNTDAVLNLKNLMKLFETEPFFKMFNIVGAVGEVSVEDIKNALALPSVTLQKYIQQFVKAGVFQIAVYIFGG